MYVCYIDESGTPELPGNTSHFVLAGLSIPIEQWKRIDQSVSGLLQKYGLADAELHTGWILRKYPEQDQVANFEKLDHASRRAAVERQRNLKLLQLQRTTSRNYKQVKKTFAHTLPYVHLTMAERTALVTEVADLIASWTGARLFAECIDKTHFDPTKTARSISEQAFEQVVSRFEQFLVNREKVRSKGPIYGILVHDNNETVAKKHTALMRQFHQSGTLWTQLKRIIDTPLFVDSSLTRMVQLSDVCAYALRRYFENNETDLFRRVFVRADRVGLTIVGVRHFAAMTCACEVCFAHRTQTITGKRTIVPKKP